MGDIEFDAIKDDGSEPRALDENPYHSTSPPPNAGQVNAL
jgi:hypothetical protein